MAGTARLTVAEQLRRQANLLLALADQYERPSRTLARAELLIDDVEQIAADVRAIARGR